MSRGSPLSLIAASAAFLGMTHDQPFADGTDAEHTAAFATFNLDLCNSARPHTHGKAVFVQIHHLAFAELCAPARFDFDYVHRFLLWYNSGMRRTLCILVILALAGCASAPTATRAAPPTYLVIRVIDGDTFVIQDDGGIQTRVRLRRVNAPECGEPGYEEAKAALEAKILNKRVRLIPYARDRYGRLLADLVP
jgi:hypothetical protein